jgi:hypothetical protein
MRKENRESVHAGLLSDAGPILDPQAKAEYRRRLDDLRRDLEEAERFNVPGLVSGRSGGHSDRGRSITSTDLRLVTPLTRAFHPCLTPRTTSRSDQIISRGEDLVLLHRPTAPSTKWLFMTTSSRLIRSGCTTWRGRGSHGNDPTEKHQLTSIATSYDVAICLALLHISLLP